MEGRDGGLPVDPVSGEQRRPSRADNLRLTRMPQRPLPRTARPPANPDARQPEPGGGAAGTDGAGPLVATPDGVRDTRTSPRRWPWIAAGVAAVLAVPIGLAATGRMPGRDAAAAIGATGGVPSTEAGAPPDGSAAPNVPEPPAAAASPSGGASGTSRPAAPGSAAPPSGGASSPSADGAPPAGATATPTVTGKANPSRANLALQASVTASASEGDPWAARFACDGDQSTRWSSGFSDPQWIRADLGRNWRISEVKLIWERAYGVAYRVETSIDGKSWTSIWSTSSGTGGTVTVTEDTVARYVRMYGTKRSSSYGYSLIEWEIR
ncbi:discoidin domain-containing protein [Actinoplanes sp. NEAU-A12]|uniref:Discoidin domain-containing protein n=1 Tax=Actinoplanes sandaracinus TaxID=3045177 RepID=A0ABT6WSA4_9ACTN|nr:discoidin domain-containing protein [Actinoplanes sandaracinus]MDI6102616.1 discoidin domain-containing protein [Actinoplanes sandaracinus]